MAQVVVGLGNPDAGYRGTRHNVGHLVIDHLAARLGAVLRDRGPGWVAAAEWAGTTLHLAKPVGFMNVIGTSVAGLLGALALEPGALIVVHDDLDLPLGTVRVRHRGRHGGHNGVRSVIETLGTSEFRRVKVGIGRPETRDEARVVEWVLSPFTLQEHAALPVIVARAADAALALVASAATA